MSTRAAAFPAAVLGKEQLSEHFVRLVLGGEGLAGFASTGVPDEWVALTVPGQFQTRYYTVRSWTGAELVLDVVVHDHGLVTEWASGDCVGDTVTVSEPRGSFAMPSGAQWLLLVGDLTALPAIARIIESRPGVPVRAWCEVPGGELGSYITGEAEVHWLEPPAGVETATAAIVERIAWPEGDGYFWMAGESAQMRAIRKHLMREVRLPSSAYDVMGYWRGAQSRTRQRGAAVSADPGPVDPGPIWREGKALGRSDAEIWEAYDAAQAQAAGGRGDG